MLERWRARRREAAAVERAEERREQVIAAVRSDVASAEPGRVAQAAAAALAELLDGLVGHPLWHGLDDAHRDALTRFRAGLLDGSLDAASATELYALLDASAGLLDEASYVLEAMENWVGFLEDPEDTGYCESVLWLTVLERAQHDGAAPDILTAPLTAAGLARVRHHLGLA